MALPVGLRLCEDAYDYSGKGPTDLFTGHLDVEKAELPGRKPRTRCGSKLVAGLLLVCVHLEFKLITSRKDPTCERVVVFVLC